MCMYKSDGRWNDANCGMKYAGFVCKKYPNGPPIDPSPTPPAEGEFTRVNIYLFKQISVTICSLLTANTNFPLNFESTNNRVIVCMTSFLPVPGGCEVGWYRYGNDCYRLMGDSSECTPEVTNNTDCTADFPTAQTKCTEMGANLVSIHNKYENGELKHWAPFNVSGI